MRNVELAIGEIYHIYNRGVDKRKVFLKEGDYYRFYSDLFLYNDKNFFSPGGKGVDRDVMIREQIINLNKQQPLARVLSYCFLPNHFHLLLEQRVDEGISKFMHRVTMGYARYFNTKYERTGRLFEGTFKAVHVRRDTQLEHLPRYIHLNALDLTPLPWREGKIKDWGMAEDYLNQYPWSSHHLYCQRSQPLPLVDEKFVKDQFPTPKEYWRFIQSWSARSPMEFADGFEGT